MAFGLRYFAELRSKYKGVFWRVEIAERGYADTAEQMSFDGNKPLSITWEKRGDEFFIPVKASEATINILCTENFKYIGLFTADPRRFRVSVFRNTKLYWRGYVVADLYSENFAAPPYQVSIKAVDGFNLLQSIPFMNLDGTQITGRKSLWELMAACIELLELEVDVADWMDLYAEGMSESLSPLRQVFVDMERLYGVYDNPSYRDILELCLRPFAGQIFQSNGALHIRRTISLYNDTRPMSFYSVGKEFPVGWIITADGRNLMTHDGEPIITEATRERIESIWEEDINVSGESVLDIIPALRRVKVSVKNKMMANLIPQIGYYDLTKWYDPNEFLTLQKPTVLMFVGDSAKQGAVVTLAGFQIQQCTYPFTLEYTVKAGFRRLDMSFHAGDMDRMITITYGVKITGPDGSRWLRPDGNWNTAEEYIVDVIKRGEEANKKIEMQGIPISGTMTFMIKQTLQAEDYGYRWGGIEESCGFWNMSLTIDTGKDYEDSLSYEVLVNQANNVDMSISLPIADIPNIPNDRLIYSLYFTNSTGKATRMWRTKGGNDYNTLVNHLVQCALRYKQLPGRRIGGEMFTGKHIDMNTVVQDDKYLKAGFYVNSIQLDALDDSYDTELTEMPRLLQRETPPSGDDCVLIAGLPFTVKTALRCENMIVMLSTDNRIFIYDAASGQVRLLLASPKPVSIHPADGSFAVVDGVGISIVDYRGVVIKYLERAYSLPATYMGGYFYIIQAMTNRDGVLTGYMLNRPGFVYTYTTYRRGYGYDYTYLPTDIKDLLKSFSALVINTGTKAYLHDRRSNTDMTMTVFEGSQIKTISDYFMAENNGGSFKIYRRDTITSRTLIKSVTGTVDFADHTLGEVAYSKNGAVSIWIYVDNTTRIVKNLSGGTVAIKGLFYINGELYIVRENALYKYIP